jgi:hypothetical protein
MKMKKVSNMGGVPESFGKYKLWFSNFKNNANYTILVP